MYINTGKSVYLKTIFSIVIASMMFLSVTSSANAQVYSTQFNPRTNQEFIAYLYGIIAQLQSQLSNGSYNSSRVLGISTFDDYDIDADTGFVFDTDSDGAILSGSVDLDDASYADVYFEYSEDSDANDERTRRVRIYRGDKTRFTLRIDNLDSRTHYYYRAVAVGPDGRRDFGSIRSFFTDSGRSSNRNKNNDDEPDVTTRSARDIDDDRAELRGEVDMNDFRNGIVFFVYGEDENDVEDVDREDQFSDIDERGDDLQKVRVDSDLDRRRTYERRVTGLDDDTEHFFRICVEFEDEDSDDTLECGRVLDFETDRD